MTTPGNPRGWRPTAALYRAFSFATTAIGLGVAFGRADVAVLGIPIALGLVLALSAAQPDREVLPAAVASTQGVVVGDRPMTVAVEIVGLQGVQLVSVSIPDALGDPGRAGQTVPGGADGLVLARTRAASWGTVVVARPDLLAAGPDALFCAGPLSGDELDVMVPPGVEAVGGFELPPILGGWAGEHRSRRAGQGGDLIDLREFVPGDRLRSIHWRAYARHQKLFVRRTQSDADTEFVLCLDTRHEILPQIRDPRSDWHRLRVAAAENLQRLRRFLLGLVRVEQPTDGRDPTAVRSSIDLMVAAATAVTATQLHAGDRVGILDLSAVRRHVRMGSGSRHLQRVRYQLAQVRSSRSRWMPTPELWGLPPSAVVVLFSSLIDDVSMQAALDAAGRGHQVVVVDVLPTHDLLQTARTDRFPQAVKEVQLLLAERRVRLDRLRGDGIPVLTWDRGQIATDLTAAMKLRRHRR
ncbi:DUF58 domain-containing protein [Nakamurella sp. PAMC28650]|uniref:DUF58 domain-containing protein n=1 Tax=Nakamurella sp. PAMC28650 TaxID=2762325 RepID=UPI00164D34A7|nr:DUF58 domain-containing protein [Nakamurella sp. PAMC28650]QNK83143.1 DUF58 domain-containing protein [Nakamurella sp. PAMC28650]